MRALFVFFDRLWCGLNLSGQWGPTRQQRRTEKRHKSEGHTPHCAARLAYGDGECECGVLLSSGHPIEEPTKWTYVLGFMFSEDYSSVALIRKARPDWQRGLYNGIGGKVEPGETVIDAMRREFLEETGCETTPDRWKPFATMFGKEFLCYCFVTTGDIRTLSNPDPEEPVSSQYVLDVTDGSLQTIENLPWLVPLAFDHLEDGRPNYVRVRY
jgi:8-oxo-dGTP diphosphatase